MTLLILFVLGLLAASVAWAVSPGDGDVPVREATAKRKPIRVPLDRLVFASADYPEKYFCHRADPTADIDPLVDSLTREGQLEPVQVARVEGTDTYLVIAGHRRVLALSRGVEQQSDPSMREDMPVECALVTADDPRDLLVASLATNAQRKDLSAAEVLAAVKKLREAGVSNARGADAVGYGRTQYERFVALVSHDALYRHVLAGDLGITKATKLAEAAAKAAGAGHAQTLDDVVADFGRWAAERRAEIEGQRAAYQAAGKEFPAALGAVDRYVTTELFREWVRRVEEGEPMLGDVTPAYGVLLDEKKARLTIPAINNLDLRSAPSDYLLKIVEAVVALPHRLAPFIKQAVYQERVRVEGDAGPGVNPVFRAFLRDQGFEDRLAEIEARAAEARAAEAGEPVRGEAAARPAVDTGAAIDAMMRRAGAARPVPAAGADEDGDA